MFVILFVFLFCSNAAQIIAFWDQWWKKIGAKVIIKPELKSDWNFKFPLEVNINYTNTAVIVLEFH